VTPMSPMVSRSTKPPPFSPCSLPVTPAFVLC
jgi:hypothetical protein